MVKSDRVATLVVGDWVAGEVGVVSDSGVVPDSGVGG